MSFLKRLKFVVGLLFFYLPARDYASKQDYGRAKIKLSRYFKMLSPKLVYPEVNILMSLVSLRLGEARSAVNYALAAFDQLEGSVWKYGIADRLYLKYYCSNLIRFVHSQDREIPVDPRINDIELSEIDLGAVHRQIKSNFPLLRQPIMI